MEVIRKIVDLDILRSMIDIPKTFKCSKVEILILPVEDQPEQKAKRFNPKSFYGISNIKNIDQAIQQMRDEWDRI